MKDQTSQESSDPVEGANPDSADRQGDGSARHGGKHGRAQEDPWMEKILDPVNLEMAWKRVKSNKGAPGVDGMTIAAFPEFHRNHWTRIESDLWKGTYHPAPVRRVMIPKPDGSQRPLGVPTVLDRVIQQAIAQVLTPVFDAGHSDHSHGFRVGRSSHGAVRTMEEAWKQGRRHGVDCDLKGFIDTVNHERLLARLRSTIGSGVLLRLIGRYLRAGVAMPDGSRKATEIGVPQGGPTGNNGSGPEHGVVI